VTAAAEVVEAEIELPQRAAVESLLLAGICHPKKRAFLRAYCEVGTISHAARLAKITRQTHRNWLYSDERYAEAFDEAKDIFLESLETEMDRRAFRGVLRAVRYQGQVVGYDRDYSDTLAIVRAKALAPERYRDRADVRHTGADGGAIKVEAEYELSRRIMDRPDLLAAAELLAAELYQTAPAGELDAGDPIPVESEEVDDV
jgi:hypothetical protein